MLNQTLETDQIVDSVSEKKEKKPMNNKLLRASTYVQSDNCHLFAPRFIRSNRGHVVGLYKVLRGTQCFRGDGGETSGPLNNTQPDRSPSNLFHFYANQRVITLSRHFLYF